MSSSNPAHAEIAQLCDFDSMVKSMAAAAPSEECGISKYHTMTYGWLIGGFVQAVAAKEKMNFSYSQLVKCFITEKAGIEAHCFTEIPPSNPRNPNQPVHTRLASVTAAEELLSASSSAEEDIFAQLGSMETSDSRKIAGFDPRIFNDVQIREACIPSCNTHFR